MAALATVRHTAGIDLTHIPYRGEAPAIPDLVAGRIDVMFLVTAKPLIDNGQLTGLAVTSAEPWFNLPGIRPFTELGYNGLVFYGWNGLMAPKGTPPAVVSKLSAALAASLNTDASVRAFNAMGFKPGSGTPDAMAAQIESDMEVFTRVIRERQLKFEG
jgi:tripartite-type tricarboxylate transporter receptor subunit TctC